MHAWCHLVSDLAKYKSPIVCLFFWLLPRLIQCVRPSSFNIIILRMWRAKKHLNDTICIVGFCALLSATHAIITCHPYAGNWEVRYSSWWIYRQIPMLSEENSTYLTPLASRMPIWPPSTTSLKTWAISLVVRFNICLPKSANNPPTLCLLHFSLGTHGSAGQHDVVAERCQAACLPLHRILRCLFS